VVLPADTVYGLCGDPHSEAAASEIYRLKRRPAGQPLALLAKDVDTLLELVPELPPATLQALLPGPYTLVLPNPARRFPWLTGSAPETIGVRVPELTGPGVEVLEQVGAVLLRDAHHLERSVVAPPLQHLREEPLDTSTMPGQCRVKEDQPRQLLLQGG
jgi:L-threonylcarbamoyladenylate synthase